MIYNFWWGCDHSKNAVAEAMHWHLSTHLPVEGVDTLNSTPPATKSDVEVQK